jgi:hypothetical protein
MDSPKPLLSVKKEIRKFSELRDPVAKGRVEYRYRCPFCVELTGKEDRSGSLYFNVRKRVGSCWKCRVVIVDDYNLDIESLHELYYAKQKARAAAEYDLASWSAPAEEVPWALDYLQRKRGFSLETVRRYAMRAATSPQRCVVLPDRILPNGRTNFFQVRYLDADKIKYSNPTEADKPLYGQHTLAGHDRAFICEGCFSSISMSTQPGWGSLATYGKAVSPLQQAAIGRLRAVREFCVVYDGGELHAILSTAELLADVAPKVSVLLLPYKEDPNSLPADSLAASVRHYRLPVNSLSLPAVMSYVKRHRIRDMHQPSWDKLRQYVQSVYNPDDPGSAG